MGKKKNITPQGRVIIGQDKTYIHERKYHRNTKARHVRIPGKIRKIRYMAFADCPNLEKITFDHGALEHIGGKAFTKCTALKEITLPDSLKDCDDFVFEGCTGLEKPVFNQSGTILFHYPSRMTDSSWQVPVGVCRIASTAFTGNDFLKEVTLPVGLTELDVRAFCDSGVQKIIVPSTVKRLRANTCVNCSRLETVILLGNTKIEHGAFPGAAPSLKIIRWAKCLRGYETHWAMGLTFLKPEPCDLPEDDYLDDPMMEKLSRDATNGDPGGMWDLGCWFEDKYHQTFSRFFRLAANYWKFYACLYGNPRATSWYLDWDEKHPGQQLPSVINENCCHEGLNGTLLALLGYQDFWCHSNYHILPTKRPGVIMIYRSPDNDGCWEDCVYKVWFCLVHRTRVSLYPLNYEPIYYDPSHVPEA